MAIGNFLNLSPEAPAAQASIHYLHPKWGMQHEEVYGDTDLDVAEQAISRAFSITSRGNKIMYTDWLRDGKVSRTYSPEGKTHFGIA